MKMIRKTSQTDKRIISYSFEVPDILEEDIIYVRFFNDNLFGKVAKAYSTQSFFYQEYSHWGRPCIINGFFAENHGKYVRWSLEGFLRDLKELNDGKIDLNRLIEGGITQSRNLKALTDFWGEGILKLAERHWTENPNKS